MSHTLTRNVVWLDIKLAFDRICRVDVVHPKSNLSSAASVHDKLTSYGTLMAESLAGVTVSDPAASLTAALVIGSLLLLEEEGLDELDEGFDGLEEDLPSASIFSRSFKAL